MAMTADERIDMLERIRNYKKLQHFFERRMFIDLLKTQDARYSELEVQNLKKYIRGEFKVWKERSNSGYDDFE